MKREEIIIGEKYWTTLGKPFNVHSVTESNGKYVANQYYDGGLAIIDINNLLKDTPCVGDIIKAQERGDYGAVHIGEASFSGDRPIHFYINDIVEIVKENAEIKRGLMDILLFIIEANNGNKHKLIKSQVDEVSMVYDMLRIWANELKKYK